MFLQALYRFNNGLLKISQSAISTKFSRWQISSDSNKELKATIVHDDLNKALTISFRYINDEIRVNKLLHFHRKCSDKSSYVLSKISEKVSKYVNRKEKKKSPNFEEINVAVQLVSQNNGIINDLDTTSCVDSFVNANNCLIIGDIEYKFEINPPMITALELPKKSIIRGYYVYPSKLEGINYDISNTELKWFRSKNKFDTYDQIKLKNMQKLPWEEIGKGFKCITSNQDISRLIKVVGTPVSKGIEGLSIESISSTLVSEGPESCPFERRHQYTSHKLNKDFLRIVSYNLLADFYADSEFSRTVLFPTCPPYALDIEYRKQLFIKEILGYNADVICLQEVDKKVFLKDLSPLFSHYGLKGTFSAKGTSTSEGLATFHRLEKLKPLGENLYLLSQELEVNPIFAELAEKIRVNQTLYDSFVKQKAILQVNVFVRRDAPADVLIVGTTHLYSDSQSDHIRLLQAWICLRLLEYNVQLQKEVNPEKQVSVLVCGDFNSIPESGVFQLMTSQRIDEEHKDWQSKPGQEVKNVAISHNLRLESACGTPHYTNYTVGFKGCLDYIFFESDKFSVEQVVPFPSHEEVTEHQALPSVTFPSDHLALVADLKWK